MIIEKWVDNKTDIEWYGTPIEDNLYLFGYRSLEGAQHAIEKGYALKINPIERGWSKLE